MESFRELLPSLDDLEIFCEEHGMPCIGLCSNSMCKEKIRFLCEQCVKSGNTCITKEKHEIITLVEMLSRIFGKEGNKLIDFSEIYSINQIISKYHKNELNKILSQFKSMDKENSLKLNEYQATFLDLLNYFIESFKK